MNRHKPMLMMLLRNGGSKYTNAIDYNGRTPLHYAAGLGDAEVSSKGKRREGGKEERKEGRKEGRRKGRKEGRKSGKKLD